MARVLRPGGVVVVTDLDSHEFEFLRTERHDRWKGFERVNVELVKGGRGSRMSPLNLSERIAARNLRKAMRRPR